jgi:hypothetical protein
MEVLLANEDGLIGWLIRWFTKYDKVHSAIRYPDNDGMWLIHSTVGGVQPEWWSHFTKKFHSIVRWEAKFEVARQAADNVAKRIGHKGYDYLSITGFAIVILLRKVGIKLRKNPLGSSAFMCTEVLVEWVKECNKLDSSLKIEELDSELTTPQMLAQLFNSRPDLFEKRLWINLSPKIR